MVASYYGSVTELHTHVNLLQEQRSKFVALERASGESACFRQLFDVASGPVKPSAQGVERLAPILEAHRQAVSAQRKKADLLLLVQSFEPLLAMVADMRREALGIASKPGEPLALQASALPYETQGALTAAWPELYAYVREHLLTLLLMAAGPVLIAYVVSREYRIAMSKQASAHSELLETMAGRLDYHFTARQVTLVLLLLWRAVATCAHESVGACFLHATTHASTQETHVLD